MFQKLANRVIHSQDFENPEVRRRYGMLAGIVGIVCNLLLFAGKLLAGAITASVSITADAFNNLSDAGSSIVTLIGFRIAGIPADREHPFGHGRAEYIAGLVVSFLILFMAFELFTSSVGKILNPEEIRFHWVTVVILVCSMLLKLWMFVFQRRLGRQMDSSTVSATAKDSLSDIAATAVVLAGLFISAFAGINMDGYIGILVACFIGYSGFTAAKETISDLVGEAPDQAFTSSLKEKVLSYEGISGVHDLIVHNYGAGHCLVSLHAEVPCNVDILAVHDTIDNIEKELLAEFGCHVVIHMDPVAVDDKKTVALKEKVLQQVRMLDPALTIHDFRMVEGPTHTNLIFDVVVPYGFRMSDNETNTLVCHAVKSLDDRYEAVVTIDHDGL